VFLGVSYVAVYLGVLLDGDEDLGADPNGPLVVDVQQADLPPRGSSSILHPNYF
jgi:hypothetical protein